jgi:hypothetical protein
MYKDPDKQREYKREWARTQRSKANTGKKIVVPDAHFALDTPAECSHILEICVNEVMASKMEAAPRARCVASLVQTAIKLQEWGSPQVNLQLSSEWMELKQTILETLQPWPEIRLKLSEALMDPDRIDEGIEG